MTRLERKGEVGCLGGESYRADREAELRPDRVVPSLPCGLAAAGRSHDKTDLQNPGNHAQSSRRTKRASASSPLRRCGQAESSVVFLSITAPRLQKFRLRFPCQCMDACQKISKHQDL